MDGGGSATMVVLKDGVIEDKLNCRNIKYWWWYLGRATNNKITPKSKEILKWQLFTVVAFFVCLCVGLGGECVFRFRGIGMEIWQIVTLLGAIMGREYSIM
jgi:hypothetical protein